ncbi:MAG TPA: HAMP domain-containing sensor histidine kinase [Candidatus Binatia bacterium]|jgi:signal transduction histidine kinase|nr:HAMP domain-containing sensor histidine kinase [Candidatus Binatia bacterium]
MALPFIVGGAALNAVVAPDRLPERLGGLAAIGVAHLIAGRLSRSVRIVPHARLVVLLFNLTTFAGLLYLLSLSPGDVDVLAGTIAAMLVGSTLLYPWGVGPQAIFSVVVTSVYLVWAWPHFGGGGMRASNAVLSITIGAAMSIIGAWVLERSRRQAFVDRRRVHALAVQRRHLLDIGRDLRSTLTVDAIAPRLVEHARRLIAADVVTLVVRGEEDGVHRMVACTDGTVLHNFLEIPIEEHIAATFRTGFGDVDLRLFPGTPHDDVITPVMEAFDFRRGCAAIFGPAADPTGWISWLRHDDVPFSAADRLAVLGITDQAHTALAAAALYEDAARASRLKTEFVSTMSHELRTPLNVITGYAQILAETLPPDPETAHAITAVQRASRELLDLIDATLDLGRLENGHQRIDEQPVPLRALFDELASEFAAVPRAAGVTLTWEVSETLTIIADRRKLRIVVKNLVGNALKFTPAGSVRVDARAVDGTCQLRVTDTGIGIRPDDQAIVFEMYRQADSSDSRRFGGTGLGLYIVRRLLDVLGGRIGLESTPGSGSTFTVLLPVNGAAGARAAA